MHMNDKQKWISIKNRVINVVVFLLFFFFVKCVRCSEQKSEKKKNKSIKPEIRINDIRIKRIIKLIERNTNRTRKIEKQQLFVCCCEIEFPSTNWMSWVAKIQSSKTTQQRADYSDKTKQIQQKKKKKTTTTTTKNQIVAKHSIYLENKQTSVSKSVISKTIASFCAKIKISSS